MGEEETRNARTEAWEKRHGEWSEERQADALDRQKNWEAAALAQVNPNDPKTELSYQYVLRIGCESKLFGTCNGKGGVLNWVKSCCWHSADCRLAKRKAE